MHILSDKYRSEFLETPQLIRFEFANGDGGYEPSLLIKTSTLMLKYIVQGTKMNLVIAKFQNYLLYAVKVFDDPLQPGILWSIAENESERKSFFALLEGKECMIFLFNELALNIAWNKLSLKIAPTFQNFISQVEFDVIVDYHEIKGSISSFL